MPDTNSDSKIMRHALNTQILDRIAVTISVLFNPFLLPLASILLIVRTSVATTQQGLLWMVIVILFASVLPMLFILLLFRLGQLSDFRLTVREQRAKPLIFSLVSALVGIGILYFLNVPREIVWLCIACVINGLVLTLITQVWKISFHSGVAAGCMTGLVTLISSQFVYLFILLPFIAWARVHRKRHTYLQTIIAAPIAVASTAVVLQLAL
ncbi:hypothetical protein C6502_12195 [Candidatus Poribacteria bacterium]|nr:MAG: hypothetical protein C6502_12195 [Candidatus Poribacteria bacterium]